MSGEPSQLDELRREAGRGDRRLFSQLLAEHRSRLRRAVSLRIDRRLQGRLDPSDVIQDAYLEASTRLGEYLRQQNMPFFIWLRLITLQKLALLHRRHLGTQARDAGREVALFHGALPEATSTALAAQLLGRIASPSEAALASERRQRLQEGLERLDPIDREVLVLRHFEELTNLETAQVLQLKPSAASNRYIRALKRLEDILSSMSDGSGEEST
jgi:RNA polymerase sigma-70 factor (ECF subfamily)